MPELPEVETARIKISSYKGLVVKAVKVGVKPSGDPINLRKPLPDLADLNRLVGYRLGKVMRRGKYLFLKFSKFRNSPVLYLVCHFGMTGMLNMSRKIPHEVLRLKGRDGRYLTYNDPRKFGLIDLLVGNEGYKRFLIERDLGPEVFHYKFCKLYVRKKLKSSRTIKDWLLDQKNVAGIGNIYASEILFRIGIHPLQPAKDVPLDKINSFIDCTRRILNDAVELGGSTINSYASPDGELGGAQNLHLVYGREGKPCTLCHTAITKIAVSGRSTYFCESCQPLLLPT